MPEHSGRLLKGLPVADTLQPDNAASTVRGCGAWRIDADEHPRCTLREEYHTSMQGMQWARVMKTTGCIVLGHTAKGSRLSIRWPRNAAAACAVISDVTGDAPT